MKYLLVANETLGSQRLRDELRELSGPDVSVHLVVPATPLDLVSHPRGDDASETSMAFRPWSEPSDAAKKSRARAQHRLREGLGRLSREGIEATGEVGSADPLEAIADALAKDRYDEIIVSTLHRAVSHWLRMDLPSRAHRKFGLPVTHVEAQGSFVAPDARQPGPAEARSGAPHADISKPPDSHTHPSHAGKMTIRDRAVRRLHKYHCKACGTYYPRRLQYCPVCKTRKGLRGDRPAGGWGF